jgi:hypothetical protein
MTASAFLPPFIAVNTVRPRLTNFHDSPVRDLPSLQWDALETLNDRALPLGTGCGRLCSVCIDTECPRNLKFMAPAAAAGWRQDKLKRDDLGLHVPSGGIPWSESA